MCQIFADAHNSPMVPAHLRASAYGLFIAGYGVFWFIGSAFIGVLYDHWIPAVIAFRILAELAAIPFFMAVRKHKA